MENYDDILMTDEEIEECNNISLLDVKTKIYSDILKEMKIIVDILDNRYKDYSNVSLETPTLAKIIKTYHKLHKNDKDALRGIELIDRLNKLEEYVYGW